MNSQHYDIAYAKLTDYMMQFCVSRIYGGENAASEQPRTFGAYAGFVSLELGGDPRLEIGDLLLIQGHKDPAWRLGWLHAVHKHDIGVEYLVKSVMGSGDTKLFANIDVSYFHRPTLAQHPEWRWTNEQHLFADEYMQTLSEKRDLSLIAPMQPVFSGDSVELKARARYGLDEFRPSILIPDFRNLTSDLMVRCYDELCQTFDTGIRHIGDEPAEAIA